MSQRTSPVRPAFTTLEAMMALVLIALALLTLQGTATVTMRRITDSHRETLAADLARQQLERIAGSRCAAGSGLDSLGPIVLQWVATPGGGTATVDQQLRYPISTGIHSETVRSVVSCR